MIGIPVGLLVANGIEWYGHKYLMHGVKDAQGQRSSRTPFGMKVHWNHHRSVRLNQYRDDERYMHPLKNDQAVAEIKGVLAIVGVSGLLLPVTPFFALTMWYGAWNYWHMHSKSHLDPEYGKHKIPWHYDHHMNTNQDANWCVTKPWFDYIMGTRVISSADLQESNPLGIKLPKAIENRLNKLVRRYAPQTFANLDAAMQHEQSKKQLGLEDAMPEFS